MAGWCKDGLDGLVFYAQPTTNVTSRQSSQPVNRWHMRRKNDVRQTRSEPWTFSSVLRERERGSWERKRDGGRNGGSWRVVQTDRWTEKETICTMKCFLVLWPVSSLPTKVLFYLTGHAGLRRNIFLFNFIKQYLYFHLQRFVSLIFNGI